MPTFPFLALTASTVHSTLQNNSYPYNFFIATLKSQTLMYFIGILGNTENKHMCIIVCKNNNMFNGFVNTLFKKNFLQMYI